MRRRSRTIRWSILAFAAVLWLPGRAAAQEVERAVIGGGLGVLGGVAITMATVVARAHIQSEYLHEPGDLIHWQSGAMIAAPAAGVVFGLRGRDALVGSVVGSVSGLVVGSGLGVAVGRLVDDGSEALWAGGAIGGGLGLAVGGLVGGILGWDDDEPDRGDGAVRLELRLPVGSP